MQTINHSLPLLLEFLATITFWHSKERRAWPIFQHFKSIMQSMLTVHGVKAEVVIAGLLVQLTIVNTFKTKRKPFTNSYEEETADMDFALSWISTNVYNHAILVLICTHKHSICQAHISSHPRTTSIDQNISIIFSSISIQ